MWLFALRMLNDDDVDDDDDDDERKTISEMWKEKLQKLEIQSF